MWPILRSFFREFGRSRYRHSIDDALALYRRGEVRSDGLTVKDACVRLEIIWHARDIHPWDRDLPAHQKQTEFAEQALDDTEAAVLRIFERRPEIDVIDLIVLQPKSQDVLATGTVHRSDLNTARPHLLSVNMRLRQLGVTCRFGARDEEPQSETNSGSEVCGRRLCR